MNGNPANGGPESEPQASARAALNKLMVKLEADFLALALYDGERGEIRWRIAFGALSERYKGIAIRIGKGIAGDVVQSGRPLTVRNFPEDVTSDPLEYPIMIVEKLISCYAAPVGLGGAVFGALMAGDRKGRIFTKSERDEMDRVSRELGKLYGPCYEAEPMGVKPAARTVSPLMRYLNRYVSRPEDLYGTEILDQGITRIPETMQVEMTGWLNRLMAEHVPQGEHLRIAVERKDGNWISLQAEGAGRLEEPHERLDWLIGRVGELKGHVEMYNEPVQFRVCIYLPVGLMAEDAPWVF